MWGSKQGEMRELVGIILSILSIPVSSGQLTELEKPGSGPLAFEISITGVPPAEQARINAVYPVDRGGKIHTYNLKLKKHRKVKIYWRDLIHVPQKAWNWKSTGK